MKNSGIQDALEMLDIVHNESKKYNITYTMLFGTLYNSLNGNEELFNGVKLCFFLEDYLRMLDILKEYEDKGYYVVNYQSDQTFEACYSYLYKRSNIKLGKGREKDERFYDNFITLIPIITSNDGKAVYNYYMHSMQIINSRAIVPGSVRISNCLKKIKNQYYYSKKGQTSVTKIWDELRVRNKEDGKQVFIPYGSRFITKLKDRDIYKNVHEVDYYGHKVFCIIQAQMWIDAYYTKADKEKMNKSNVVVKDGTTALRRVQLTSLEVMVEFDRICRKYGIKYIMSAGTLLGAARHKGFIPWDDDIDIFILYSEWKKFIAVADNEIDHQRFFVRTQDSDEDNNLCFFQIKRNGTVYCKNGRNKYNTHLGVFIDIFPFFKGADTYLGHCIQNAVCKFYKTATWTHMGAESEISEIKRKYYYFIKDHISNKEAYNKFIKWADKYKEKKTDNLCYLYVKRNPYKKGFNQMKYFDDLIDMEFEGHLFYAPKDYEDLLAYSYSKDWKVYPKIGNQINHHFPAIIDLGSINEL